MIYDIGEWFKTRPVCKLRKLQLPITSQRDLVFKNSVWTGVIPFHGFSMYGEYVLMCSAHITFPTGAQNEWYTTDIVSICPTVAPLCFLYNEPSKLYSVFREMYIRHFFRLHSISSSPSVRAQIVCDCYMLQSYYSVCVYMNCKRSHVCSCRV